MEEAKVRAHQLAEIGRQADHLLAALEAAKGSLAGAVELSEQDVRREAAKLVETCYEMKLPPPLSLSTLVARCVGVKASPFIEKTRDIPIRPKSYAAWDRAVLSEAEQSPGFGSRLTASVNSVANAAFPNTGGGANPYRRTIEDWRESAMYTFCVNMARTPIGRQMISDGWATFPNRPPPKKKGRA